MSWFEDGEGIGHDMRSQCGLSVAPLGTADTAEGAWELLPRAGEGWICLTDRVVDFDAADRSGRIVSAEVADGDRTVVVRFDAGRWTAWELAERPGTDHRKVVERFLSTAPDGAGDLLEYATYWKEVEDDGLGVWTPVASRFLGWTEDGR